jgi:hypothetical protein
MDEVEGTLYENSVPSSTFRASRALADKASAELKLDQNVVITSRQGSTTLRSDSITWASKGEELIKAAGDVSLKGEWGEVTGLQQAWATPDLKAFGTPDIFKKP